MHLGKVLVLLSISSGTYSFKIRAFTGKGCTDKAQEINDGTRIFLERITSAIRPVVSPGNFWTADALSMVVECGSLTMSAVRQDSEGPR